MPDVRESVDVSPLRTIAVLHNRPFRGESCCEFWKHFCKWCLEDSIHTNTRTDRPFDAPYDGMTTSSTTSCLATKKLPTERLRQQAKLPDSEQRNSLTIYEKPRYLQRATIWCGFWPDEIFGSYFCKNEDKSRISVTRHKIIDFLSPRLYDMDPKTWFQQDGATYHERAKQQINKFVTRKMSSPPRDGDHWCLVIWHRSTPFFRVLQFSFYVTTHKNYWD